MSSVSSTVCVTGVHILLEVAHRLMVLEAWHKGLITGGQPARKLKEQPEVIKGLREYNQAVQQIPRMRIRVRTITPAMVRASEAIRVQEGLMTNDSVTGALMRKTGVTDVATADADFNNASHIRVYQPGDIPYKERRKVTADSHCIVVPHRDTVAIIFADYRVCFIWRKDGAYQVEITDYH